MKDTDIYPSNRHMRYAALSVLGDRSEHMLPDLCASMKEIFPPETYSSGFVMEDVLSKTLGWLVDHQYANRRGKGPGSDYLITFKGISALAYMGELDPTTVFTWDPESYFEVLSDDHAVKKSNEGMFYNKGMNIGSLLSEDRGNKGKGGQDFFRAAGIDESPERDISLYFCGKYYDARIEVQYNAHGMITLMWGPDLCEEFHKVFPAPGFTGRFPLMHFERMAEDEYHIYFDNIRE